MYFKWKNEYQVNIAEIDKQHKHLFEIGTRIYDLANVKDSYDHFDEIMAVLQELKDYSNYHFSHEEKLMEQHGYENFEKHQFEHYFVIKKLQKFVNDEIDRNQKDTVLNLVSFVSDWITNHILQEDMKYKDFLNNKGVQ